MDSLIELSKALDQDSYTWLETHSPEILYGIEQGIRDGAEPSDVFRWVMTWTDRRELALRCQQAARHVQRSQRPTVKAGVSTGIKPEFVPAGEMRRPPQIDG